MDILGIKIGGAKKSKKKKPINDNENKASGVRKPVSRPRKNEISSDLLEKRMSTLVKSFDEIPENSGVVDTGGVEILSEDERKSCIILSSSDEDKKCFALVSKKRIRIPVDGIVAKAQNGYKRHGWSLRGVIYIESSLIDDVYRSYGGEEKGTGSRSDMEKEFDDLLLYACDNNISDIHIEVNDRAAFIRVRRNSLLEDYTQIGVEYATDFCTVIYQVLSEPGSSDISFLPKKQQSSMVVRAINGHGVVRVRLNTIPTSPNGFDMVLRVLKPQADIKLSLRDLGYNENLIRSLEVASAKPTGALIIAGTTGSGKSTTLKTILEGKVAQFSTPNGVTIKIITVEDPPEYNIQGVSQCNVSTSTSNQEDQSKNPFGDAIKAAMRCDPDILMAGEVRDEDSAELLMHITLSGHQVMTTIHASSAISIIARLRNNGIPNDALGNSDFISGLVYQKLVPKVCNDCGSDMETFSKSAEGEEHREIINRIYQVIPGDKLRNIVFRNKSGCSKCRSGVVGQTVVAEVILPDHDMLTHFISGEDHKAWHHHKAMGGETIIDHAHQKIYEGVCDPRDIEVKIGLITMDIVMEDSKFEYTEMGKHGYEVDRDIHIMEIENLNGTERKKVERCLSLISAKKANGEINLVSDDDTLLLSTMVHNNEFSIPALSDLMIDRGIKVSNSELSSIIGELKNILR